MKDITVEDVKNRRYHLEAQVERLLEKFHENTGVPIQALDIDYIDITTHGDDQTKIMPRVNAKITL